MLVNEVDTEEMQDQAAEDVVCKRPVPISLRFLW